MMKIAHETEVQKLNEKMKRLREQTQNTVQSVTLSKTIQSLETELKKVKLAKTEAFENYQSIFKSMNAEFDTKTAFVASVHKERLYKLQQKCNKEMKKVQETIYAVEAPVVPVRTYPMKSVMTMTESYQVQDNNIMRSKVHEHRNTIETMKNEFKCKTKKMEHMYNETYEAIASDLKKTKQELEAVNNEWMKSLNENDTITKSLSNLTKELGTLKVKHEEEMSFAETKHSLSIESVKRELQDFAHISQKDEEDHQNHIAMLQNEFNDLLIIEKTMKKEVEDKLSKVTEELKKLKIAVLEKENAARASILNSREKYEKLISDLKMQQETTVEGLLSKNQHLLDSIDKAENKGIQKATHNMVAMEAKLACVEKDFRRAMKRMKDSQDNEIEMLRAKYNKESKLSEKKHAQELSHVNQELSNLKAQLAETKSNSPGKSKQIKELKCEIEEMHILLSKTTEQVLETKTLNSEELHKLEDYYQLSIKEAEDQHQLKVDEFQTKLSQERGKIAEITEELEEAKTQLHESQDLHFKKITKSSKKSKIHYMENIMKDRMKLRKDNSRLLKENSKMKEKLRTFQVKSELHTSPVQPARTARVSNGKARKEVEGKSVFEDSNAVNIFEDLKEAGGCQRQISGRSLGGPQRVIRKVQTKRSPSKPRVLRRRNSNTHR